MADGQKRAARWSGILAQALAAWALVFTVISGSWLSSAFVLKAMVVSFRTDGTHKDRAISNFSSGIAIWSVLAPSMLYGFIDKVGGGGPVMTASHWLMLAATVLFVFAGAFYWIHKDEPA